MDVTLNEVQKFRKELILKGINGLMTNREIAMQLYICRRRVQVIKAKYKKLGDLAFVHGNTGRTSPNKIGTELKAKIIKIKEEVKNGESLFQNVNFSHFRDILSEEYNIHISRSSVQKILKGAGFVSPKRRGKTKKYYMRARKEYSGELVQADGSSFDWLGTGVNYCIQGFVDDATGIPLGLFMTKNECLFGYIEATRMMLMNHGIPEQMYPDRSGIFFVNIKNEKKTDESLTQYGRIMKELGVDMFPAYSPQAKGRIERFWQTIQSRLPIEFKIRGIKTIDEANAYLPEYIKKFSRRFGVQALRRETKFVQLGLPDMQKLNDLLLVKIKRKTDSAGVISIKGYKFMIKDCIKREVFVAMSEKDGIYALTNDKKKHKIDLVQVDQGKARHLPQVQRLLIAEFFFKNGKGKYKDVYFEENVG